MAVVTATHYFSNAIQGVPGAGGDINVNDVNTNPKLAVGFGFTRADGNKYRYAQFAEAFRPGWVMGPIRSDSSAQQSSLQTCGNTSTAATAIEYPIPTNQVGSHFIQVTSLTAVAQQYNGCYVTVYTGPGAGCTYRIADTKISQISGSSDVLLQTYEPLTVALTTASTIMIASLPYNDLFRATHNSTTTLSTQFVGGIAVGSGATGQYGWVITHGLTSALQGAKVGSGTNACMVSVSSVTAGAIDVIDIGSASVSSFVSNFLTSPIIGTLVNPGSAGGFSQIYVTLE